MSKLDKPGYPLPDGELGADEIVCQLVFLPNRPEYWQAFVSAYHYMTTWRAWERDEGKRGRDAAANWRDAFELTMECWRMACLQDLQDDVAAILAILENPQVCCDEMDVTGGDQYTDRVTDGVGDVPQNIIDAGYADDAADWPGFDDYKCMIAHVLVDQIEVRLASALPWMDQAGKVLITMAILSALFTVILTAGGAILAVGVIATTGIITGVYAALLALASLPDLIQAVSDNHDELACAIYQADGDESALIALNDKIDELFNAPEALVLTNMNLGPTLKALYAGRYDQQDVADNLAGAGYDVDDFDCDVCAQIGEFRWLTDYDDETFQGWQQHDDVWVTVAGAQGAGFGVEMRLASIQNYLFLMMEDITDILEITGGAGDVLYLNSIKFNYMQSLRSSGRGALLRLVNDHDGGSETEDHAYVSEFTEVEYIFEPPLEITWPDSGHVVDFRTATGVSASDAYIDNITLDVDYTPA